VSDNLLRKGIDTICNLFFTDSQWLQASLPVKDGGLGVRRLSLLASSAFLVSAQQPTHSSNSCYFAARRWDH